MDVFADNATDNDNTDGGSSSSWDSSSSPSGEPYESSPPLERRYQPESSNRYKVTVI